MLAEAGSPLPSRARHLAHTAAPGDADAATLLRAAADAVGPSAPSIAADWLIAAKRVSPPADFGSFSDLAEVLVQSGRLGEALRVADEGLSFGAGSDAERVRLVLAAASVERLLGRHEASLRRLSRTFEEHKDTATADLTAALALSAYERGDYADMDRWARLAHDDETADAAGARRGRCDVCGRAPVRRSQGRGGRDAQTLPPRAALLATDSELAVPRGAAQRHPLGPGGDRATRGRPR